MAGRILIANELATGRILLKAKLSAAHYDVLVAPQRCDAVALAAAEAPDVVLLEVSGPGDEALELCRALKANPATSRIAILARTSGKDAALRCAALAAGADDALAREAKEALLLARLRSLMRARHAESEFGMLDDTRAALGFAEPAATFERPGTIALVARWPETARAWDTALAPKLRDRIEVLRPADLLDGTPGGKQPDLYVISTDVGGRHEGLSLIAELRSRAPARSAAILAVAAAGDSAAAISALDLGADDVMEEPADAAELVLRLRALLRRKARADRLRRQLSDGLRLAVTDPLTGLYNRRYALSQLERIAERSVESGRPFAVMVLDLDWFKRVNDGFGHVAGDAVLTEVARRIAGGMRAVDLVARLGGEEFLVVMPDTGADAARSAAERLRRLIEAAPFNLPDRAETLPLTVSIGVALGGASPAGSVDALVGLADRALYTAKADGRNQVTVGLTAA